MDHIVISSRSSYCERGGEHPEQDQVEFFFLFMVGHAVCDFVLQPKAMGMGKNLRLHQAGRFDADFPPWGFWLGAHALTHGGAVYLVSGAWGLGVVETALHAGIDHLKCIKRISLNQDQALHALCKVGYAILLST